MSVTRPVSISVLGATLIGYMESIAIGKNLAATNGYEIDAGQEMLALGIANVLLASQVRPGRHRYELGDPLGGIPRGSTPLPREEAGLLAMGSVASIGGVELGGDPMAGALEIETYPLAIITQDIGQDADIQAVTAFLGTLFLGVLMGILVAVGLTRCLDGSVDVGGQILGEAAISGGLGAESEWWLLDGGLDGLDGVGDGVDDGWSDSA
eukprot:Skav233790  [mRNA]  locus=scaffold780:314761:320666:- [translate_table: standard]